MPKGKKNEPFDPQNMKPEDVLKFEIATELGLSDKVVKDGWRSLTAKESGRIGGLITKRKRELKQSDLQKEEEQ
ncbi:MAG: small, acid-soluble spore protein, alpha/beta type [Lacrimispora sp.]|uniref:small, acid-soluble spore protein, alpha/beta type n=1 Tax=Lacrimispora sp. TaxID=2719234 RepID=UPI0039E6E4E8